jgi:hypothetical protein
MRIPNAVHEAGPWRIHELASDFLLEDAWALPVEGVADDFDLMLETMTSTAPAETLNHPARILWGARDLLGRWFGLGEVDTATGAPSDLPIPGTEQLSLAERLPDDLRGSVEAIDFRGLPFEPVFRTKDEFVAELSNATVHAIMHLVWVPLGNGRFQGRMGVYVKPRGRFGRAYMAFIKPFRYAIVYPALMRGIERKWAAVTSGRPEST